MLFRSLGGFDTRCLTRTDLRTTFGVDPHLHFAFQQNRGRHSRTRFSTTSRQAACEDGTEKDISILHASAPETTTDS